MLQVTLEEPGRFVAREAPSPRRGEGEALVRIRRIGVCGTDLHAFRGRQPFFRYPRVLGHELAGEIVEIGTNERGLAVGDRVAVEPYLACGECRPCRAGRYNCCASLEVLGVHRDGGMQEWLAAPVRLLHSSPQLSLEQLALVETLGIGYHAVERAALREGEWVVVVGAGPIGLAVMQFALLAGARVIALDLSASRLEFCRRLGVEHTVQIGVRCSVFGVGESSTEDRTPNTEHRTPNTDPLEGVLALTGPDLAHCVFDATGSLESMSASLGYAGAGGRVVMVGLAQGAFSVDDPLFHRRELSLFATRNSAGAFPAIIRLMEEGRVDTTPWITHYLELAALPEQFPRLLEPDAGVVKAMIVAE